MSSKQKHRKRNRDNQSFYPFKYKTIRNYPDADGTNTTTYEVKSRNKLASFEEFVTMERDTMEHIFKSMKCNALLVDQALDAVQKALMSSPAAMLESV